MAMLDLRAQAREVLPALPVVPDSPALRLAAQQTWRGRMINEYSSAAVFTGLAHQLVALSKEVPGLIGEKDIETCAGFAAEERRHGVLCGSVVEALGGEAIGAAPEPVAFPRHADVTVAEAVARNVMSISCLSETIAVSLIGAEREEIPPGELLDLLTRIWSDEIGHARFGWRLLGQLVSVVGSEGRSRLHAYLRVAFGHLERHELAHLPVSGPPPEEGVALGVCSGADARVLFYETVEQVIVPSLEQLGLDATEAWRRRSFAA